MRFSRNGEGWEYGSLLRRLPAGLLLIASLAVAQSSKPISKKAAVPARANELSLTGLRPGKDTLAKAATLFGKPDNSLAKLFSANAAWEFIFAGPRFLYLLAETDHEGRIQSLRILEDHPDAVGYPLHFSKYPIQRTATGHGLIVGQPAAEVKHLYGEPDSKSPSSRDGQQLELWYYAFDWAGADVPQVMEVLCTKEQDGTPGRVIEITLAAPSL